MKSTSIKSINTSQGFTLIELVMVILIAGILAVVAFFQWPGYNLNLGAKALQLQSDVRYTQALSMNSDQRYYLSINTSTNSYQILNASGTAIVLESGGTTATLGAGIAFGLLTNLPNKLIQFNGSGIPYTTTSLPGTQLASTATIPMTTGSFTQTISITPLTGMVSIS
jgi:prepilin-type N-terminal cleavage/methylation domain-containing protein